MILLLELLERRQLALKICANSVYGALGVSDGRLPLLEGARFIADYGRILINRINDFLVNKYNAFVIYNDTDSSMFKLDAIKERKDCHQWGNRLAQEISGISKGEKK